MSYVLNYIDGPVFSEINLPASKSISNRLLIIQSLCDKKFEIENLSAAADTKVLKKALQLKNKVIDAGEGGTTLRFLLAFLMCKKGEWKLTGSKRLMQRPTEPLVEAIKKLGGDIVWKKNYWLIKGSPITGGKLSINANISSQFISALLLVAPAFKNGLQLTLKGKVLSSSYIDMTIELMRECGIDVSVSGKNISVPAGKYQSKKMVVETDWSAASYFYELATLNPGSKILLEGLINDSLQGDRVVAELFEVFGVESSFTKDGVLISSERTDEVNRRKVISKLIFDIKDYPDLFPALVVTCAVRGINATFKNTSQLNSKESERANVFAKLLNQFNCRVKQTKNTFSISGKLLKSKNKMLKIKTQNDHRIAMSVAPLAGLFGSIKFDKKNVVNKSFPEFWKELKTNKNSK